MNTAAAQKSSYGDPLALLKHCDATTLEKLCDTLTNTSDDTVAYINFPKRSLVKCFSARDKYEWHIAQTAELEDLQKRWESIEQERKEKNNGYRKRRVQTAREKISDSKTQESDSGLCVDFIGVDREDNTMLRLNHGLKASHPGLGRHKVHRLSPEQTIKSPRKKSLSPLVVNEDILQEALIVAENFQMSEESDLPSPLSSCQKSQCESSESFEFDLRKRHVSKQPGQSLTDGFQTHGPKPFNAAHQPKYQRSAAKVPHSFGVGNTRKEGSSHIFANESGSTQYRRKSYTYLGEGPGRDPFALTQQGQNNSRLVEHRGKSVRNKADVARRGKPSLSQPPTKTLAHTVTTPRNAKQGRGTPRKQKETRSGGAASAFRGALSHCLGSKHGSIDLTHSPKSNSKTRGMTRELSTGPSSRSILRGSFRKSASSGAGGSGSFGGINMHASVPTSNVWK